MNQALKELLLSYLTAGDEIVIGADVSKDNICIWVMSCKPEGNFKEYFKEVSQKVEKFCDLDLLGFKESEIEKITRGKRYHLMRLYANTEGANNLIGIKNLFKIKALVMEPTGLNYSWIFSKIAEEENIPVRWVGHEQVKAFRVSKKLPGKNDLADAVGIAAMTLENQEEYFLEFNDYQIIQEIRFKYFLMKSVVRMQSPVRNRLSQQLAREFPEAAFVQSKESAIDGISPLVAFVGKIERNLKRRSGFYEEMYKRSIAPKYGIEISSVSRKLAVYQNNLQQWEKEIENDLKKLLENKAFEKYNKVFDEFGFGVKRKAWIICQVYPIEKFSYVNLGKKVYSLAKFKQYLGFGRTEESSGDKEGTKRSGSKIGRTVFFNYVSDVIIPKKGKRNLVKTPVTEKLCQYYDRKMEEFNPETFEKRQTRLAQILPLNQILQQMRKSKNPDQETYQAILEMKEKIMNGKFDNESGIKQTKTQVKEGFKKLLICNTGAYTVKVLFKELLKELTKN